MPVSEGEGGGGIDLSEVRVVVLGKCTVYVVEQWVGHLLEYVGVVTLMPPPGRVLKEVTLSEPIRYAAEDPVEGWLHSLLCLDATSLPKITTGCPPPNDCELYPSLVYLYELF